MLLARARHDGWCGDSLRAGVSYAGALPRLITAHNEIICKFAFFIVSSLDKIEQMC
jgi:hypothetical protein